MISLLAADGMIAGFFWYWLERIQTNGSSLSAIGPAAMALTGTPLTGSTCDPAGYIIATALWW